jgi:pimeloyl-ACP methyl ester carboxylesterase
MALLPSPLLGPSVWQPVAQILAGRGWHTVTCAAAGPVRTAQDALDAFLAELPDEQELVLVPHSNAGAYVPALVMQRRVLGVIFVDSVLPPGRGHVPLAPPAFLDLLRAKADDDGLLPVWTAWWDEDVSELFPNTETRTQVEREQRHLPLSYLEAELPVPPGWDERPAAYLAFGDTYADERDEAARRQWPVTTLPGEHLHQLINPDQVAAELVTLVGRLGISVHMD